MKSTEINNAGLEQVVNRPYLIDAVSYTDAETRIYKEIAESVKGDFQVKSIKESNIKEIIGGFEGEWFWKVRIQMVSINENNGPRTKAYFACACCCRQCRNGYSKHEQGLVVHAYSLHN